MSPESVNRREFAKRLAAGAAVAPLAGCLSQDAVAGKQQEPQQPEQPKPPADQQIPPERLLLEVVRKRYPDKRLTLDVLASIQNDIRGDLARSKVLSSFPLNNWDEPRFVFAAYRNDD